MLGFIYRLMVGFEQEHGYLPNTLYMNKSHVEHLTAAFDEQTTLGQIMDMLAMEMILDQEAMHPRVSWTQAAQRIAS